MLNDITSLITAISQLLWAILPFVIFFTLRKQIIKLLPRVKKAKIAGQEFELDEAIDKFQESVKKSSEEIPESQEKGSSEEQSVLRAAASDPKVGMIILAREIEKEIRELYATMGMLNDRNYVNPRQALEVMIQKGYIPKHTAGSLEIFQKLRNTIVHGYEASDEKEVIRVLDIGMTLLQTLKAIPHETNIVYHPDVEIFSDPKCTIPITNAKGLMLETLSPGGVEKSYRIYPTTKIGYYKKGERISWEWDLRNVWNDAWYKDPKTKEIKQAWNSSGNFIGRHIDEI